MTEISDIKSRIQALCSISSNFLTSEDLAQTRSAISSLLEELKQKTNYDLTDQQAFNNWENISWHEIWSDFHTIAPVTDIVNINLNRIYHHQLSNGVCWNFHDANFCGIPFSILLKSLYHKNIDSIDFTFTNVIFGLPLPSNSNINHFSNFINGGGLWGLNLWFKRPVGIIGLKFELRPIYVDDDFRVDNLTLKNYTDKSGNLLQGSDASFIVLYTKKDYF